MPDFVEQYVQSDAFADDPTWLILGLNEYCDSLLPYADSILAICDVLAGPLAEQSRSAASGVAYDVSRLSPLLLRLYEQAQDQESPNISNRCLDAWDLLFENRVGLTRELTKAIDK